MVVLVPDVRLVLPPARTVAFAVLLVGGGGGVRASAPGQVVVVLQPVDDEEVARQRAVGGVAEAALLALVRRAVRLVLRDVQAEGRRVGRAAEAADGALERLGELDLRLLHRRRLWTVGAPGVQAGRPLAVPLFFLLWFPLGASGLWKTSRAYGGRV